MRITVATMAVACALLSGCGQTGASTAAPAAGTSATNTNTPRTACATEARTQWQATPTQAYTIVGSSIGDHCETAEVTISVEASDGRQVFVETLAVMPMRNTIFAEANTQETMRAALADWINPARNTTMRMSAALPEWPANADSPQNGEFPFYPDEGVTRERYNQFRAQNTPLLCFVQGGESMGCAALAADGRAMHRVGAQAFPG